ncbi:MAG TPA: glycoside hydrolase family 44 protein [Bacteroidia bacterium]|jgi:mannan endo-1,4-beta-mannosidase|nr:glycoside hydrolase family 44 protein [Bacteroidia bacterium]
MKKNRYLSPLVFIICCLCLTQADAQISAAFTINTQLERHTISPYIYGSNGQSMDRPENITARRLGGNRLTGYNWEDNFSHAGTDYINSNDNYLPWSLQLPASQYLVPNAVLKAFHDTSLSMQCYTLLTLPMAGYVSRDGNGSVTAAQVAPSARFRKVINRKGSSFVLTPDTTDNNIYVDECLNNLITAYGNAGTANGVKGYLLDNEHALWPSTHPRIHPNQPTCAEDIRLSVSLAKTVKTMDPLAEVFGPSDYGYASFLNFQSAPDWSTYSASYPNYLSLYLKQLKLASDTFGHRLLDVMDVHWYPEAQGKDHLGNLERVSGGNNDRGVAEARIQAPRTLWDSSYIENSWIGQYYSPVAYVSALQKAISQNYPGTKLGFTEYDYGGMNHISGGLATADFLGIAGKYNVYFTSRWGQLDSFVSAAFKIYRNYDGHNSTFGDLHIQAKAPDARVASIYGSLKSTDTTELHLVVMNKDYDSTLMASFQITSPTSFVSALVYRFDSTGFTLTQLASVSGITSNHFNYVLPPLTCYHFILKKSPVTAINESKEPFPVSLFPNPAQDLVQIVAPDNHIRKVKLFNSLGELIKEMNGNTEQIKLDISTLAPGLYQVEINTDKGVILKKLLKQ